MKFSRSINKEVLTKAARNNRKKAIGYLWGVETDISASSANIVTGIEEPDILAEQSIHGIREMLNGKSIPVNDLYIHLGQTYQKGVIPVLLAVALQPIRRRLVIHHGQSVIPFSSEQWDTMDEAPEEYALELLIISDDQQQFISELEVIFQEHMVEQEKSINSYSYLQNAMQRYIIHQPTYVQATNFLSPVAKKLRDALMNFEYAPHYFLFKLLPSILGDNPVIKLKESLDEMENALPHFYIDCRKKIQSIFPEGINEWYHHLPPNTTHRYFDNHEERVLAKISQAGSPNDSLISEMAVLLTGLSLEDFGEGTGEIFWERLKSFKDTVESQPEDGNQYLLSLVGRDGNQKLASFSGAPSSDEYGKMFRHEIHTLMQDYGRSVPLPVRRQALIDVLTGGE